MVQFEILSWNFPSGSNENREELLSVQFGVPADIRFKQFHNTSKTVTASAILFILLILRSYAKTLFRHTLPHKTAVKNVNVLLRECHLYLPVFAHEFVN
jgi:hypothetical protein